jgi:hypothetical protein
MKDTYYLCEHLTLVIRFIYIWVSQQLQISMFVVVHVGEVTLCLWTAASTGSCSSRNLYVSMDSRGGMILSGETEYLGEKLVPVPLCPQIPHGITRARTPSSAVRSQQLTTWAMARPISIHAARLELHKRNRDLDIYEVLALLSDSGFSWFSINRKWKLRRLPSSRGCDSIIDWDTS